jgi:uncharacterized repeat protein (TIGR01451 family)
MKREMSTETFPEINTARTSRRATLILLSVLLACLTGVVAQAAPSKGKRAAKARGAASKNSHEAREARLRRLAKRGNPLAGEEGDREAAERNERHGKRAARSERTDKPNEAMKAYLEQRLPQGMKELPIDRYFEAQEQMKQMQRYSTAKGELLPSEAETGAGDTELLSSRANAKGFTPDAALSAGSTSGVLGTWQPLGPGNVGGRTRAIIIDPVTPNTMYAAGVAGGVWKSTDAGANWAALDDFMANIAVTSLAFEPGNSSVIYAGTGEGYFNGDAVRGAGIFKSTDAGATWTRLASTNTSDFFYVQKIVVGSGANSQHVYAATRTGVWRSLDGGANWTEVIVSNAANGANGAMDLAIRTDQSTDYVFAAVGTLAQSHIWRNTDAGGSGAWVDVYTETAMERTALAIAPSNQSVIYAMAASNTATPVNGVNYQDGLLAVFRSTSSGDAGSWTTQVRNNSANKQDTLLLSNPINAAFVECGFAATNNFLHQGWYDNILAVDPTDENKVWAGGTDLFRSDNGGVNWGVASYWWFQGNGTPPNNGDPQLVHADNHAIVFHPQYNGTTNQIMYAGNDGGIYKTDNAKAGNVGYVNGTSPSGGAITSTSPICGSEFTPGGFFTVPSPVIWGPLNNGYAVTQFWPGAIYPDGATYFSGTQDNGTNRGADANGPNQWERILGGDGGYAAVDPTNTNVLYAEQTNLSFQKSTNGGVSFAAARTGITEASSNFLFTAPFYMDPLNSQRLYLGGARVWKTTNAAGSWASASGFLGFRVSALATSPQDANYGLFGGQAGHIWRTQTLTTDAIPAGTTSTWAFARPRPNDFVSWVTFDPTNKNVAYATYSTFNNGANVGHVWKSVDAGVTWTVIDGTGQNSIPDIPVHTIAVDPNNTQRLYVGTDLGVFVTLDGGANWAKETTGFSNTVVKSLNILNVGGVSTLYAFTHGRGLFKVAIPASCATVPANASDIGSAGGATSVNVTSASGACTWNAVSNDAWIHVTGGASGAGAGTVSLSVDQNTTGSPRTGTLTIAGQTVSLLQRALPVITWNNPADIVYGTALGATQLNATANVPGAFTYTPAAGTVLSKGAHNLHADFAPTDTANYDPASKDVSINVLSAVLNVSMTADRNPAPLEQNFNYNATITNTGDASATNTVLTDVLPVGVTFTASSPSQGTCSYASATRTVTCNLGTIAAGSNATVQLTIKPRSEGTIDNTATVTASQWDPATGNSSASVNGLQVKKYVDLAVQVLGSANPIFAGQNVTYTITVKNVNVTTPATGVVLTDVLPASMNFVSATTSQGSLVTPPVGSNGTVTANLGSVAPGATATVTITVSSTTAGVVTNSASATSTEADSTPANNTGSATTTVNSSGLLKVLLASQSLIGGCQNTTGNVYLTGPAGPGGVTVPLSTSNLAGVTVPASVFIPAGQSVSPAFNVTTSSVATKQVGLVTAGSGPGSVSRGLTVNVGSGSCPP